MRKHRGGLKWQNIEVARVGGCEVAVAKNLGAAFNQGVGIRRQTSFQLLYKAALWPTLNIRNKIVVDGFIERRVGQWVQQNFNPDTVFLDIGCGAMGLSRFIPGDHIYNALDIELSEFHVRRVFRTRSAVNLVAASAKDIPLEESSVSLIASAETFAHIQGFLEVAKEMYRILRPGGILVCSIPNNFCNKYQVKGPHAGHVNDWSYQGFLDLMESEGFRLIEGLMMGRWIRLPPSLIKTSYQLPFSSIVEEENTNFFYKFSVVK